MQLGLKLLPILRCLHRASDLRSLSKATWPFSKNSFWQRSKRLGAMPSLFLRAAASVVMEDISRRTLIQNHDAIPTSRHAATAVKKMEAKMGRDRHPVRLVALSLFLE